MNKPKIRFKEYSDDFEENFLNYYLETSNKKNTDNKYNKYDVLSVSGDYGIVNQIEFQGRSFAGVDVSNYGIVDTNDVVYTKSPLKRNPYGIIKANYGTSGIVSTLYAIYKVKEFVSPNFIQTYFCDDNRLNSYLKPLVNKGAKNDMKVSDNNALLGKVRFPKYKEQIDIAKFISNIEKNIQLCRAKLDKFYLIKKSMLEKMFPATGKSVPKIRFKGFSGDWEIKRLKDIADKIVNKNINNEYDIVFTNSANLGIIEQSNYFDREIANSNNLSGYYIVDNDFFVYNPRISTVAPVGPINRNKLNKTGVMSPLYYVFKVHDVDKGYLEYYFKSSKWHKFMYFNGDSGARSDRFSIKDDIFIEMPIAIPRDIDEQKKIADYFEKIDNLINRNNMQLEKLQNMKKALLSKMFV